MPSIKDVAAAANVSLSTVSKVLNERSDANIPVATRDRIRLAARRIGYHPSALARGLAGKRMNTVGVVMAYDQESITSDPYLGPCLDGILTSSKQYQQKVTFFMETDWADAVNSVPVYGAGHCDGLIVIIPRLRSPFLPYLQERVPNLPFVLVGDSREEVSVTSVDLNNVEAARLITKHLLDLGHRRIAAFCGNVDFCSNEQRLHGYRLALLDHGIAFDPHLIFEGEYHAEWGAKNVHEMMTRFPVEERPTAIFGLCDAVAVGAMKALQELDMNVPVDISVVGIDNIPRAGDLGLTTIKHPIRAIGVQAIETLLGIINKEIPVGARVLIEPDVIVRQSTGSGPYTTPIRQ